MKGAHVNAFQTIVHFVMHIQVVRNRIKYISSFPGRTGMLCFVESVRSIILAWGPAIRGALASDREEQGLLPPSSPVVGGRLARQLICAGCNFCAVQSFLALVIEYGLEH